MTERTTARTDMVRLHLFIEGRVQGVWYRESTRQEAVLQKVAGWVRNRPDGSVEAVFEGDPSAVNRLLDWARQGPPGALVTTIDVHDEEPRSERGFSVRR